MRSGSELVSSALARLGTGLWVASLLLCVEARASAAAPVTAGEILARMKAAQGGAAWDEIRSLRALGAIDVGGLHGHVDLFSDLVDGRFRDAYELGPMKGASGFDGATPWTQDASGASREETGREQRETALTEAFRRSQAWWYPARRAGSATYEGERAERGRRFHVVSVTPEGGRRFELWVDASTWLADRLVEQIGAFGVVTTFRDWRAVGGVKLPFLWKTSRGEPRYDELVTLEAVEINVAMDAARFARPSPARIDHGFSNGRRSTTIPFALVDNHIFADVRLDGRGPYRLLVDAGGMNLLSKGLAKALGMTVNGRLAGAGAGDEQEDVAIIKIGRVDIGDAFLEDQIFFVCPVDEMSRMQGVPVVGLIGYEVFARFVARIDYENRLLTLHDPHGWTYEGPGVPLPFVFNAHLPQVDGEVDGIPGKFDLDTASRASLDLLAPFVEKHGLVARYGVRQQRIDGWGGGGPSRGYVVRAHELKLGPIRIEAPVTGLSTSTTGAFANPYVAGRVGGGVLSRFTVILDYTRQVVFFEKNGTFGRRDTYDKAGWWLHADGDAFEIVEVVPGTPAAAAGLEAGDRILAVDGVAPPQLSLGELRRIACESPAGTKLQVRVRSRRGERVVTVALRDLV